MSVRAAAIKLGLFTLVTLIVTAMLATLISNVHPGRKYSTYKAQFSDVTGLLPGDDVRIAGVAVGRVTSTDVDGKIAVVKFQLRESVDLTTSVRAAVRYRNLLGQRYISLAQPRSSGEALKPGSTIPIGQTSPALDLTILFNGFRPLLETVKPADVNALASEIIKTLQGEGGTVSSLLAHTASLTTDLASRDAAIARVVQNLSTVVGTIGDRDDQLSQFISELQRLTSGLAADRDAIGEAVTNLDTLTGLTANLLHEARPDLDPIITSLAQVLATAAGKTAQLDQILRQLPVALAALQRAEGYGSWLNLYVLDLKLQVGDTVIPIPPGALEAALRKGTAAKAASR